MEYNLSESVLHWNFDSVYKHRLAGISMDACAIYLHFTSNVEASMSAKLTQLVVNMN